MNVQSCKVLALVVYHNESKIHQETETVENNFLNPQKKRKDLTHQRLTATIKPWQCKHYGMGDWQA